MKGSASLCVTQNFLLRQMKPFGNAAFMRNLVELFPFVTSLGGGTGWQVGRVDLQKGLEDHKKVERAWASLWRQMKALREFMDPSAGGGQQTCQVNEAQLNPSCPGWIQS